MPFASIHETQASHLLACTQSKILDPSQILTVCDINPLLNLPSEIVSKCSLFTKVSAANGLFGGMQRSSRVSVSAGTG